MYFLYLLIAVLFFGVLIAIHEFGHFATAKWLGVKVNEFSIGMGPALWKKQQGETMYALRIFPIGGYCAMEGEDENTGDPRAFSEQCAWKKLLILAAGALMNFLFGLLLAMLLMLQVQTYVAPVISDFMDGFPLEGENGLMVGDEIIKINGDRIYLYSDVSLLLSRSEGAVDVLVLRDGEKVLLKQLPLELAEYEYNGTTGLRYGLIFTQCEAGILQRLQLGWNQTLEFVRLVWLSLGDLIRGQVGIQEMSGVIGIVDTIGTVGAQSQTVGIALKNIVYFVSFIAVNLAVMNLLPIPALDGGRIFFVLVNGLFAWITKRDIDPKYEGYIHNAGFVLLLILMVVIAMSDVWKLIQ